jgi:hypothetical protein
LELFQMGTDGSRISIANFWAAETPLGEADLVLAADAGEAATLPKVNHQKMELATGQVRFSLAVPAGTETYILRITDPMGQASEIEINS